MTSSRRFARDGAAGVFRITDGWPSFVQVGIRLPMILHDARALRQGTAHVICGHSWLAARWFGMSMHVHRLALGHSEMMHLMVTTLHHDAREA